MLKVVKAPWQCIALPTGMSLNIAVCGYELSSHRPSASRVCSFIQTSAMWMHVPSKSWVMLYSL